MILLYLTLFGWSFAAATVLPLSSEAALAGAVTLQAQIALPVAVATAGNVLGAFTTYWLGMKGAAALERRVQAAPRWRRASALLRRFGAPALLLAWVPLLGDVLVALAGAARMPFLPFAAFTFVGKFARYLAVAWSVHTLTA